MMTSHPLYSIGSPAFYAIFMALVLILVVIDMLVLKKEGAHQVSTKEALIWTMIWIAVSLGFAGWLYYELASNPLFGSAIAREKVLTFLTGYVLEKSLSIDNIFVFILIFSYLKIPAAYQQKVLLYGVLSAIILRGIMVALGAALVSRFEWILYIFGIFLLYSGIKLMWPSKEHESDLNNNRLIRWLNQHLPISQYFEGNRFFIRQHGHLMVTPLLLAMIIIEISDIIFAVDSIPAVFAVTTDPFIVFTSNILAVLGLRALYFLLANIIEQFVYLKYGLACVLSFIGTKMLIAAWIHINSAVSLVVILSLLSISMVLSWLKTRRH